MVEKIIIGVLAASNIATAVALSDSKKKYAHLLVEKDALNIYASARLGTNVEKALQDYCEAKEITIYDIVMEEKKKKEEEEEQKKLAQQQTPVQQPPQAAVPVQPIFQQAPAQQTVQPNFTMVSAQPVAAQ